MGWAPNRDTDTKAAAYVVAEVILRIRQTLTKKR